VKGTWREGGGFARWFARQYWAVEWELDTLRIEFYSELSQAAFKALEG